MLIVIFTPHVSNSYDKFISVSVGAYILEEALMELSVERVYVESTLRVDQV